jgi:uncharacterized protein (TIGR04255 family)
MNEGRLPKKLKHDAILEAILEIRFDPAPSIVPEIFMGRFADRTEWSGFRYARLAAADMPAAMRSFDPILRYQPSIEMTSPDGGRALRFGPQVVQYSRRGVYPLWENGFANELSSVVEQLYQVMPGANVRRLGLRYVNALRSDLHGINDVSGMAMKIVVAGHTLTNQLNLNFKTNPNTDFETMSRIASADLAEGAIPENATVIVDIDVYTSASFAASSADVVKDWVNEAHDCEKRAFFNVLGAEATNRLRED